jgi:Protein of unknown function (DUF3237)
MPEIRTAFLFTISLEVDVFNLGDTPYGGRRIARFGAGSFEGPTMKGTVLPGGSGSTLVRRDGVLEVHVRVTLETDDNQAT